MHYGGMNAYSEDLLPKKLVEAKERGMPTAEVARTFGVGLSSAKRYTPRWPGKEDRCARRGEPGSTRRPKADERAR